MPAVRSAKSLEISPLRGMREVREGDDVGELILRACQKSRLGVRNNDVFVVTHKIISKAEGRVIDLKSITPSKFAIRSGKHIGKDPRQVEMILSESRRLVKMVKGLIISETRHGFVCANAGVDQSNVEKGKIVLLPEHPDESCRMIRNYLKKKTGKDVAVIMSDTFGRPWREGQVDVAIGLAGIDPFSDYRGMTDQYGYDLKASIICVADELASAAELCMNKLDRVPVALIRGYNYVVADIPSRKLNRSPVRDLFR
ncbi:MAG: coenzyme F420-0:L-glutamate ligase [Thaumarchaeota archaeon]|nr:coenzyme F420-0:L-glutamate ligase [Nitrososphaerota archaeon]